MYFSLKYITANVVDRNNGRIVASASSVERALKSGFECGRFCNSKAAAIVGEVLAMRAKVEGIPEIYSNIQKELDKGFKNHTKIWSLINALKNHGVKLIDDNRL
ncbi:hypothetical protein AMTR_s00180p00024800 [Amborella trichopoda]|uniref:Uncharacterized protein n=2 Tax=Amborella trichopoda TaxID=13333 RepID=W1PXS9_AMBTC|nr:hypothetical protein AMTR_s00180p00024800 [Amborella trichopoda]